MKRCLKFRAKAIHNGEWVYGLPIHYNRDYRYEKWTIRDDKGLETDIEEETLCQFTGLHDKNGTGIYEGDRVRVACVGTFMVIYNKDYCCFELRSSLEDGGYVDKLCSLNAEVYEVVGNIYKKITNREL